jgi:sugar phosphate isomerase/epimerase
MLRLVQINPETLPRHASATLLSRQHGKPSNPQHGEISGLDRPACNFVNTLAEAADVVKRNGNPAFGIMIDTLAAGLEEKEPVAAAIRRWMPTGLVAHVQFNDRSKRGPGQGDDRFGPVVQALRETGYAGWIAMEPFVYEPDGPTCAARMIGYVAGLLEQDARG